MLDESTRGVFVIAPTPFLPNGNLDLGSIPQLCDYYVSRGVTGITVLGMMGEAQKLTHAEALAFTRGVLAYVAGRVPVIVGATGGSLTAMRELVHDALSAGAAGAMIAPPSGIATDDQHFAYVGTVCTSLGQAVPLVWQDYPPATGVFLSAGLYERIVRAFPQIVMLKMEDHPGLNKITNIRGAEREGKQRRTSVVVGNGGVLLPHGLARGADGVMTGFAYAEMLVEVFRRHERGDRDGADALYERYLPLVLYEQQPGLGLAIRKEILHRRGALRYPTVRAPGPSLSPYDLQEIDRIVHRLEQNA